MSVSNSHCDSEPVITAFLSAEIGAIATEPARPPIAKHFMDSIRCLRPNLEGSLLLVLNKRVRESASSTERGNFRLNDPFWWATRDLLCEAWMVSSCEEKADDTLLNDKRMSEMPKWESMQAIKIIRMIGRIQVWSVDIFAVQFDSQLIYFHIDCW